ncbi:hypothetical protein F5X98DRAFT_308479 [Xylaria grammica]|nr:hypothetical protein F5X98DRAFT_308479 [Xylaria grammica]
MLTLHVVVAAYLLSKGANPNIGGNRHFIPLVSAINAVAQSRATIHLVKLLLEHEADIGLRDVSGRTALEAANNAGLAGGEIKKLLSDKALRRSSTISMVSTVDSAGASSASGGRNASTSTGPRGSAGSWIKLSSPNHRPPG